MIPLKYIEQWRDQAPWARYLQIEQDLVISRALCDLFNSTDLANAVALRGGTAIHKLIFSHPLRYSEDIDLVQTYPMPIGKTIDAIRNTLPWLGNCKRKQTHHSTHLFFKFIAEDSTNTKINLKIEINTREHENLYGIRQYPFQVNCGWYNGSTEISSFEPNELYATKLRALLQRNQNRDLFDLYSGIKHCHIDSEKLIICFEHYLNMSKTSITRADAERRMLEKLQGNLTDDISPLLPADNNFNSQAVLNAFNLVWTQLIERIKGDSWKLSEQVIDNLRRSRMPDLLK